MPSKKIKKIIDPVKMQFWSKQLSLKGKKIGFVPTMGFFHEGHLSLMRAARDENDSVVVSIFVNPMQFGPSEDFETYPRDLKRDIQFAEEMGVDVVFAPEIRMLYPSGYRTYVEVEGMSDILCGIKRPGHFRGVTTIVCKLFNIVKPFCSYFGQKDAQQAIIISKMIQDLNMETHIKILPTVRESDGLAMSSRNVYLSAGERNAALCLFKSIKLAEEMIKNGERDCAVIISRIMSFIKSEPLADIEYVCISHPSDLSYIGIIEDSALLLLAVRIGKTRLIDNVVLHV